MGAIGTPDGFVDPDVIGGLGDGSSWANAWSSVKDITGLAAGDVVACNYAATDTLTSGFSSATNGTNALRIVMYSADPADDSRRDGFTIDGNSSVASAISSSIKYWTFVGMKIMNCTGTSVGGVSVSGMSFISMVFSANGGDDIVGNDDCAFSDCTFLNAGGNSIDCDFSCSINNCYSFNATSDAFLFYTGSVIDCVIDSAGGIGIHSTNANEGCHISGNIVNGNNVGIDVVDYVGIITKNIISGSTGNGLLVEGTSAVYENFNVYYNNGTDRVATGDLYEGGDSVDTSTNPLTDAANKDYSRASGSSDVKGTARQPGATWDTTIQSTAYVTAGSPPAYSAGGGLILNPGLTGGING